MTCICIINQYSKSMNKKASIQPKTEKSNSKKRDYSLIVDGKYNFRAIIQRAWVYVRNYGYSFKSALKTAWIDAHLKMDEYKAEIRFRESTTSIFPKKNLSLSSLYSDPCGNLAMGYVTK